MDVEKILQMLIGAVLNGILVGLLMQFISRRWQRRQQEFQVKRQLYLDMCTAYYELGKIQRKFRGDRQNKEYREELKQRINSALSTFKLLKHQILLQFDEEAKPIFNILESVDEEYLRPLTLQVVEGHLPDPDAEEEIMRVDLLEDFILGTDDTYYRKRMSGRFKEAAQRMLKEIDKEMDKKL